MHPQTTIFDTHQAIKNGINRLSYETILGSYSMMILSRTPFIVLLLLYVVISSESLSLASRRKALSFLAGATTSLVSGRKVEAADENKLRDTFDVENFIRTGVVAQPMGVSGQAGKSRPETGVVLRDGSDVSRDPRSGDVLAELLVQSSASGDMVPVLASYSSPWPLAKGTVFDVECRDPKTGDGAFLAVTASTKGKSLGDLKDSFFLSNLMAPTGRFSLYGQPTDVKVRQSETRGNYKLMDLSFSTLSQSTQTEIPRRARVIATIPEGTSQAVLLVASASASRWLKGADKSIASVAESFRAIPAPQTSLRVRAKERRS